jgi:glycosyltransferase involved in cell wall biosynthesis
MYLTDQFYLHGGIEKITSEKMNYLSNVIGYEVVLCTSEHRNKPLVYNLSDKVKHIDLGINYCRSISYFHPTNLIKMFKHFSYLKKCFKNEKPDIIISINYTPEQYFVTFLSKHIPKIKEFHSTGFALKKVDTIIGKLKHRLFLLFEKYHVKVVLNDFEKDYYPFNNITVIPNFVSRKLKTEINLNRTKTIIAAGRIAPVKQFDHLILAWEKIANLHENWSVEIYGDGEDKLIRELNYLISERNIPNIKLMGSTSILSEKMKNASIYAMTSVTECFPMVLLEAMANGLPIVSYNCPHGPAAIIENNKQGYLTETNNISIFAKKLSYLISSKSIRTKMSEEASDTSKQFQDNVVMEQWNTLFLNIKK